MAGPKLRWFRVWKARDVVKVRAFIAEGQFTTYTGPRADKNGDSVFLVGTVSGGNLAGIWCRKPEFAGLVEPQIRFAMGMM